MYVKLILVSLKIQLCFHIYYRNLPNDVKNNKKVRRNNEISNERRVMYCI